MQESAFEWLCAWATGTTIARGEALARLARRDGKDSWMQAAILCSALPHVATLLSGLLGSDEEGTPPPTEMVEPLLEVGRRAARAGA